MFGLGMFLFLITALICGSIVFCTYIDACKYKEVGIFANPRYEERIRKLERFVLDIDKALKEELK